MKTVHELHLPLQMNPVPTHLIQISVQDRRRDDQIVGIRVGGHSSLYKCRRFVLYEGSVFAEDDG